MDTDVQLLKLTSELTRLQDAILAVRRLPLERADLGLLGAYLTHLRDKKDLEIKMHRRALQVAECKLDLEHSRTAEGQQEWENREKRKLHSADLRRRLQLPRAPDCGLGGSAQTPPELLSDGAEKETSRKLAVVEREYGYLRVELEKLQAKDADFESLIRERRFSPAASDLISSLIGREDQPQPQVSGSEKPFVQQANAEREGEEHAVPQANAAAHYQSELKNAIAFVIAKNPDATNIEICRGLDDSDGVVELPSGWRPKPTDRLFEDAYRHKEKRRLIDSEISKIRHDMRKLKILPAR